MTEEYRYVCDESSMRITVEISNARIAHLRLFYKDEVKISRKYLFSKIQSSNVNLLVSSFCTLLKENGLGTARFTNEEDAPEFLEEVIRGNLKRVYTKLGLLIWQANK